jgi:hypothetical protein
MSNLVILIPFKADTCCDLDQGAAEMKDFFDGIDNHRLGDNIGAQINNIHIIHKATSYTCAMDDYVILFAHGGKEDSDLTNNRKQTITMTDAIIKLTAIGAQNAVRLLCMCCFSALEGHIAAKWKAGHKRGETYGGNCAISNLYSSTKRQIYSVCAALYRL